MRIERALKVKYSYCGREMNCPQSMIKADFYVCENCITKIENKKLKSFAKETQNAHYVL